MNFSLEMIIEYYFKLLEKSNKNALNFYFFFHNRIKKMIYISFHLIFCSLSKKSIFSIYLYWVIKELLLSNINNNEINKLILIIAVNISLSTHSKYLEISKELISKIFFSYELFDYIIGLIKNRLSLKLNSSNIYEFLENIIELFKICLEKVLKEDERFYLIKMEDFFFKVTERIFLSISNIRKHYFGKNQIYLIKNFFSMFKLMNANFYFYKGKILHIIKLKMLFYLIKISENVNDFKKKDFLKLEHTLINSIIQDNYDNSIQYKTSIILFLLFLKKINARSKTSINYLRFINIFLSNENLIKALRIPFILNEMVETLKLFLLNPYKNKYVELLYSSDTTNLFLMFKSIREILLIKLFGKISFFSFGNREIKNLLDSLLFFQFPILKGNSHKTIINTYRNIHLSKLVYMNLDCHMEQSYSEKFLLDNIVILRNQLSHKNIRIFFNDTSRNFRIYDKIDNHTVNFLRKFLFLRGNNGSIVLMDSYQDNNLYNFLSLFVKKGVKLSYRFSVSFSLLLILSILKMLVTYNFKETIDLNVKTILNLMDFVLEQIILSNSSLLNSSFFESLYLLNKIYMLKNKKSSEIIFTATNLLNIKLEHPYKSLWYKIFHNYSEMFEEKISKSDCLKFILEIENWNDLKILKTIRSIFIFLIKNFRMYSNEEFINVLILFEYTSFYHSVDDEFLYIVQCIEKILYDKMNFQARFFEIIFKLLFNINNSDVRLYFNLKLYKLFFYAFGMGNNEFLNFFQNDFFVAINNFLVINIKNCLKIKFNSFQFHLFIDECENINLDFSFIYLIFYKVIRLLIIKIVDQYKNNIDVNNFEFFRVLLNINQEHEYNLIKILFKIEKLMNKLTSEKPIFNLIF
ncbi:hypothetical protein [Guillardia theta]|uniref:Uncharacterized protein n=1 Tax=Guillardia theta TaxID=55529 RepID=Q9AVX8_GUITH|nr:hypothetical protein GTHECHR2179 [Guillardia theta]CAC27093.1 hypothetical protein [Guillardia theta]